MSKDEPHISTHLSLLWSDLKLCLVFMTRLPLRLDEREPRRNLAQASAMLPVVGLVVGLCAGVVLWLTLATGLPPLAAAAVAVAASILLTGALHEDGLADVADGFGGGLVKARKLEIMRDSRIGSYGVLALGLALIMRVILIAETAGRFESLWEIAGALIAVHVAGRAWLPAVMAILPLARSDGLAAAAERPGGGRAFAALLLGLVISAFCLGPLAAVAALLAAGVAVIAMAWLARRQIDGYTGDVLGASEQLAEVAALAAIAIMLMS